LPRKWVDAHSGIRYIAVISDARREDPWNGCAGFVHRAAMEDSPGLSGVYACGVAMMGEASQRDFIAQCTLPEDAFVADAFTAAADLAAR
jgi:CDP-4-dehydro-6-deoxyglucose reductase